MTGTATDRQELSETLEDCLQTLCDAKTNYETSRAQLQQFDQDFPEVMAAAHEARGKEKVAARGSTGTAVGAEGHATLPAAKGEGG